MRTRSMDPMMPARLMTVLALGLAIAPMLAFAAAPDPTQTVVYVEREGSDDRFTSLDIYRPEGLESPAPIVVFVHGGGWSLGNKAESVELKPDWCARNGWILVSVNYRLSPAVIHPEHARDVAAAVSWVHQHAAEFGGDPDRIALMGHSAGAHLAAIVACDEALLEEVGMTTEQLAGVIPLDGAAYNLPERMPQLRRLSLLGRMYRKAFGTEADVWRRASPVLQAQPADALAPLFCVHAGDRKDSETEGLQLVQAWSSSGTRAELYHAPDKNHAQINRLLGTQGDADTLAVEAFLESVFTKNPGESESGLVADPQTQARPERETGDD